MADTLKIVKKSSKVFWHVHNNLETQKFSISNFTITLDAAIFKIVEIDGSKRYSYSINNITIIDETDASVVETFTNAEVLYNRLVELNYTPFYNAVDPFTDDEVNGIHNANSPSGINPFATLQDISPLFIDEIITETGSSLAAQNLTYNLGWVWKINGVEYTNSTSITTTIPLAASGKQRFDLFAVNQWNTFSRIPGTEVTVGTTAVAPPLPIDMIQVGLVLVTDSLVGDLTPPVVGDTFVKKLESQDFIVNYGATTVIDHVDLTDDRSSISLTNSVTDIKSVNLSGLYIRHGKPHFVKNRTGHNVKIWHLAGTGNIKYFFPNGLDLIVKPDEIIEFNTNANDSSTVRFESVGNYTDISGKEDTANKSTSTADSGSSVKFPVWSAIVDYFNQSRLFTILGISALSGSNTGDETTSSILTKIGDGSKIGSAYLPSYVDDILEGYLLSNVFYLESSHTTVILAEVGKIYIDLTTGQKNKEYRYSGSTYIQITNGLIASTADVPEDSGFLYFTVARVLATILTGLSASSGTFTSSDSVLTAFGKIKYLIDNIATTYQSILVSGTNIKTINSTSILGLGNLNTPDMDTTTAQTISGVKTFLNGMFGLRNVANTFTSFFTNTNTTSRTYIYQDKNGTIAHIDDIIANPTNYKTVSTQTYTLMLSDALYVINFNYAGARTITIPTNAAVPFILGTAVFLQSPSNGVAFTITGSAGVTLITPNGFVGDMISLYKIIKIGTDTWLIDADVSGFTRTGASTISTSNNLSVQNISGGTITSSNRMTSNFGLSVSGNTVILPITQISSTTTLGAGQTYECTSGTFTVTLPTAVGASIKGTIYKIKNSGTGVITIATTSSQTIDGASTYTLSTQYKYVEVISNGANWIITAQN